LSVDSLVKLNAFSSSPPAGVSSVKPNALMVMTIGGVHG
jgi:hypothetical protein